MKILKNSKAFTLIELVLVVALLSISVGVTSDILISVIRSYNKTQVLNELEQVSNFIGQKMENELRNAISITAPSSNILEIRLRDASLIRYKVDVASDSITRQVISPSPGVELKLVPTQTIGGIDVTCEGTGCFSLIQTSPQVLKIGIVFSQQASGSGAKIFNGRVLLENTLVIRETY